MSALVADPRQRHKLNVAEYYRMAEAGILGPAQRCELIEGEVIDMAPIGSRHGGAVKYLIFALTRAVGSQAVVSAQDPVGLSPFSEPQPDLALLRPRADFYRSDHPRPEDVLLLVEVADTSLRYDLEVKVPLYARHGIAEVWVLDLAGMRVHVLRRPGANGYGEHQDIAPATVAPLALPECAIDLRPAF